MRVRDFTDEELSAFLDGETDLAPVAEITLALTSDTALARRLEALHKASQAIIDCFHSMTPDDSNIPDFAAMWASHASDHT